MLQLARGLTDLYGSAVDERHDGCELRIDRRQAAQRLQCAARARMRAAFLALIELHRGELRRLGEPPMIGEARPLRRELHDLARLEIQRLELANLVAQQLEARIPIPSLAFQVDHAVQQLHPDAMRDGDLVRQRLELAVIVEQFALRSAARERLEFMLPMNIDEDISKVAQLLHGDRLPIEVGARTPVARHDATHG